MWGTEERCVNSELDGPNYSSPVPAIGVYIAAATMVCLLLMILDVWFALRNRKLWIPCRFFSFNSATLSLLAMTAKLPLDLTTSMPSATDQLSKLTGTAMICVSMCFLAPSIGANRESDCLSNMVALSIFTITVVVNICIQLYTGVILLFRIENIIIICFMMTLLLCFWVYALEINDRKESSVDYMKDQLTNSKKSMLHRLKACYLYSYGTNPQILVFKTEIHFFIRGTCHYCLVAVIEAGCRSLVSKKLKSCSQGGVSDYKWSTSIIVVSQIITIIWGSLGTSIRCIAEDEMRVTVKEENRERKNTKSIRHGNRMLQFSPLDHLFFFVKAVARVLLIAWFVGPYGSQSILKKLFARFLEKAKKEMPSLTATITKCCHRIWSLKSVVADFSEKNKLKLLQIIKSKRDDEDDKAIKEFEYMVDKGEMSLNKWTLQKGVKDMDKNCAESNKLKINSDHLIGLLRKYPPSQESLTEKLKSHCHSVRPGCKMSSLSVVLLSKIAAVILPSSRGQSLSNSLDEVFEIIHFVDGKMSSSSFESKRKLKLAKALWKGPSFTVLLPNETSEESDEEEKAFDHIIKRLQIVLPGPATSLIMGFEKLKNNPFTIIKRRLRKALASTDELKRAFGIIAVLQEEWPHDGVKDELVMIAGFLRDQGFESATKLYGYIEQLFVDMLNEFLAQLPNAIFKDIMESYPEDCEESIKFALKLLCMINKPLEDHVQWSFPTGATIPKLISDDEEVPSVDSRSHNTLEGNTNGADHAPHSDEVPSIDSRSNTLEGNTNMGSNHVPHSDGDSGHIVPMSTPPVHEIIEVKVDPGL